MAHPTNNITQLALGATLVMLSTGCWEVRPPSGCLVVAAMKSHRCEQLVAFARDEEARKNSHDPNEFGINPDVAIKDMLAAARFVAIDLGRALTAVDKLRDESAPNRIILIGDNHVSALSAVAVAMALAGLGAPNTMMLQEAAGPEDCNSWQRGNVPAFLEWDYCRHFQASYLEALRPKSLLELRRYSPTPSFGLETTNVQDIIDNGSRIMASRIGDVAATHSEALVALMGYAHLSLVATLISYDSRCSGREVYLLACPGSGHGCQVEEGGAEFTQILLDPDWKDVEAESARLSNIRFP